MAKKIYKAEEIVKILREIDVLISQGMATTRATKQIGITDKTYYRWRKEYCGMRVDQAKRLKVLEKKNCRLKRLVADLSQDNQILNEVTKGNL